MPAKKNTGGEESPPVETKPDPLQAKLAEARDKRRTLEAELLSVDSDLRAAINNGDLEAVDRFAARKAELPRLFITASTAETKARQEISTAEDRANLKALNSAEDQRDALKAMIEKRAEEHAAEMAELKAQLHTAELLVGASYATITASRDLAAVEDAGFKRSMANLTGV